MSLGRPRGPESHEHLWQALRSTDPLAALIEVVKEWKAEACPQDEAERRLSIFLDDVMTNGTTDQDDPVRDVLDFVVGYAAAP